MPLSSPTSIKSEAVLATLVRRIDKLTTMAAFLDRLGWAEEAAETRAVIARLRLVLDLLQAEVAAAPKALISVH